MSELWGGRRAPVTLLGGYLGSGKTTLLNELLASADRRYAVLVNDIGAIKYLLPNPVADLAGIASPEARRYYREAFERGEPIQAGITRFLEEHEPDYLGMFPNWFPELASMPDKYRELHRIRIVDNRTMGGDEVVLYSTPWTREEISP